MLQAMLPSNAAVHYRYGRTDGLTENLPPRVDNLAFRNARAHIRRMSGFGVER